MAHPMPLFLKLKVEFGSLISCLIFLRRNTLYIVDNIYSDPAGRFDYIHFDAAPIGQAVRSRCIGGLTQGKRHRDAWPGIAGGRPGAVATGLRRGQTITHRWQKSGLHQWMQRNPMRRARNLGLSGPYD